MIFYSNTFYIDKVEKAVLVYSTIHTGSGVSGPGVTNVHYEEVTGSRNIHVCTVI